jgi:membrane protease YdiL (CAAX protease family)
LTVATAAFFYLAETGDANLQIKWLGWLAFLATGATFTKFVGMRVNWSLAHQIPVLIAGVTIGLGMVMMQVVVGFGLSLTDNIFVHAWAKDNVLLALMAGVSEEFFFRGFIQGTLEEYFRKNFPNAGIMTFFFAVIPAAAGFALFHYPAYGNNPQAFMILFIGGVMLGSMYAVTGDIGVPIIAHTVNNGFATMSGTLELAFEFWYVIVIPVAIGFAVLLYMMIRQELSKG